MFDILDDFDRLFRFYDRKLEISGLLAFTVILAAYMIIIYFDDSQIKIGDSTYFKHFLPNDFRKIITGLVIAHLFGLYKYSRKKKSSDPDTEQGLCPECKIEMSVTVARSWKCIKCGGSFPI